jgi:hypothetical protein
VLLGRFNRFDAHEIGFIYGPDEAKPYALTTQQRETIGQGFIPNCQSGFTRGRLYEFLEILVDLDAEEEDPFETIPRLGEFVDRPWRLEINDGVVALDARMAFWTDAAGRARSLSPIHDENQYWFVVEFVWSPPSPITARHLQLFLDDEVIHDRTCNLQLGPDANFGVAFKLFGTADKRRISPRPAFRPRLSGVGDPLRDRDYYLHV